MSEEALSDTVSRTCAERNMGSLEFTDTARLDLEFPELRTRGSKYSPEVVRCFFSAYSQGAVPLATAAGSCGLNEKTIKNWRKASEDFDAMVDWVGTRRVVGWQGNIGAHASQKADPKLSFEASKWLSERADPANFGQKSQLSVKLGPDDEGQWNTLKTFLGNPNAKGLELLEECGWVRRETFETEGTEA